MANIYFDIGQQNNTNRINRPRLIFLEGTDDAFFLDRILDIAQASPDEVGIVTVGGIGEFSAKIKGFIKTPDFTTKKIKGVAIIRDADDSFNRTQAEMKALFEKYFGVTLNHGDVISHGGVVFGYFLLPGKDFDGDLERLCLDTVNGTHLEQTSEAFLTALQSRPEDQSFKRKVQVYLAGHTGRLCRGAGNGFKDGQFDENHQALNPLKEFIATFITKKEQIEAVAA